MARYSDLDLLHIDQTSIKNRDAIARIERVLLAMRDGYPISEALEAEGIK